MLHCRFWNTIKPVPFLWQIQSPAPGKMKKIMIALDYDQSAEKVAKEGHTLAKTMNAEVVLVHIMADSSYYMPLDYSPVMGFSGIPPVDVLDPEGLEKLKEAGKEYLDHVREILKDPHIRIEILEGEPGPTLLQAARRENIDILVVGTHSRNAFEEMIMGSVTKKLIHDSDIPLLVIPTKMKK